MPTTVYLLRHAETANPAVFHGAESDIDLGERGVRQAEAIAAALVSFQPEIVVSSNMLRARRTAQSIALASDIPHEIEPDLHERRVGFLSGQPFNHNNIWPETSRRWALGETAYAHEGAESYDDLTRRLMPAFRAVTSRHAGRRIVIVCHGVVCKVLITNLIPSQTWAGLGSIKNVAVHELRHDDEQWTLARLGWLPPDFAERGLCS